MFGKRKFRKQAANAAGDRVNGQPTIGQDFRYVASPSARPDPFQPFQLGGLGVQHPVNYHFAITYFAHKGEIFLQTPYDPVGDLYRLVDLDQHRWIQLRDRHGRMAPVEVYIDHTGIQGRWLP